jgi:hypothetical protein
MARHVIARNGDSIEGERSMIIEGIRYYTVAEVGQAVFALGFLLAFAILGVLFLFKHLD